MDQFYKVMDDKMADLQNKLMLKNMAHINSGMIQVSEQLKTRVANVYEFYKPFVGEVPTEEEIENGIKTKKAFTLSDKFVERVNQMTNERF